MTVKLHRGGWACFLKESLESEGITKKARGKHRYWPRGKSLELLSWNFFQEDDAIQDRFVVHSKPYRDIRELLAKGIISGNIEDTAAAVTVRISTII